MPFGTAFQPTAFQPTAFQENAQVSAFITAFQPNAFQTNPLAFQIIPLPTSLDIGHTDQGVQFHRLQVYLGPSLGWSESYIAPARYIARNTTLGSGDCLIFAQPQPLVPITINLPPVRSWVLEVASQPFTGFERFILIKDLSGQAAVDNITIIGSGTDTIDGNLSTVINTNWAWVRLYPLMDLSGWYIG